MPSQDPYYWSDPPLNDISEVYIASTLMSHPLTTSTPPHR